MAGRLNGKVAVITGAASGIGRGSAQLFIKEGAAVVAADIDEKLGKELERELGPMLVFSHTDVNSEDAIAESIELAVTNFGKLDVMFNNAGAAVDYSPLHELSVSGFDSAISLLARSVVMGHKYAARQFIAQNTGGSIISTSSIAGILGGASPTAYTIAKHAVVGVVHQAVADLAPMGIRSNAIVPGFVRTPIMSRAMGIAPEQEARFDAFLESKLGRMQPMGRLCRPDDIAEAALWLASDASSFVTGITLAVDGGVTATYQGGLASGLADAVVEFLETQV